MLTPRKAFPFMNASWNIASFLFDCAYQMEMIKECPCQGPGACGRHCNCFVALGFSMLFLYDALFF